MKMKIVAPLIWLGFIIGLFAGWVMNIINIAHADFAHITGLLVIQVIGIFMAPLGSVLGWVL